MIQLRTERLTRSTKAIAVGMLVVAAMSASVVATSKPAHALTTFTINSTGDRPDLIVGNGFCDSDASTAGEQCTLRAAIQEANKIPGADTINFDIPDDPIVPGLEAKTISPGSVLPTITDAVTIDGYTQPGASPNTLEEGTNATLKIELFGASAGAGTDGLQISASNSVIKGLAIESFADDGISVFGGTSSGLFASNNRVEGNFIGTDPSAAVALGNADDGVFLGSGAAGTVVGGASPDKRNLLSGNGGGVFVSGEPGDNHVLGNLIGTKKDGATALGNDAAGVLIDSSNNFVGDGSSTGANTIAFNGTDGVAVRGGAGNRVLFNSVFSNSELSIDLGGDGVTANDPGDADSGPNGLQNFPVLSSASNFGGATSVTGTLNSNPAKTFKVQFFSNPSGENEGKTFLGETTATTNGAGNASFFFRASSEVPVGEAVTASATDPEGNTSEFSEAVTNQQQPPPPHKKKKKKHHKKHH